MSAPLVIRTGFPGNGKTLNTIKEVDAKAFAENRVVYFHNVAGLKPELLKAQWFEFEDPLKWMELPQNSIIVIDEAQGSEANPMFGVRDPRKPVPPHVSALETIRHGGYELNLITQDPRFLDVHARRLCNMHVHYWRIFGSQKISRYETPRVVNDVDKLSSFAQSSREIITLDKKMFGVYTSTKGEHHFRFKPSRKLVLSFGVIVVAVIGVLSLINKFSSSPDDQPETAVLDQAKKTAGSVLSGFAGEASATAPATPQQYLASRVPRVPGLPASAPIYDGITQPVAYPRLYCASSTDDSTYKREFARMPSAVVNGTPTVCQCYTQQATRVATEFRFCMNMVEYGHFDPSIPDRGSPTALPVDQQPAPLPSAAALPVEAAPRLTIVNSGKPGHLW